MSTKDMKTIFFYKYAQSIGATDIDNIENIDINTLLLESFLFLTKEIVLTKPQKDQFKIFQDKYNQYLEYCIKNNIINKDIFRKVEILNIITVPDMSNIKIPDIKQELKDMNLDLNKLGNVLGTLS
ncbi:MAG: hypothetical protein DRG78_23795 [Epsilonproteobacteria bacterium]|nr:MAG: hypothetical protein DRG78_23795 [Campylobacterota bacterium]